MQFTILVANAKEASSVMAATLDEQRAKQKKPSLQIAHSELRPVYGPDKVTMVPITSWPAGYPAPITTNTPQHDKGDIVSYEAVFTIE
jgi:hypothetical protein